MNRSFVQPLAKAVEAPPTTGAPDRREADDQENHQMVRVGSVRAWAEHDCQSAPSDVLKNIVKRGELARRRSDAKGPPVSFVDKNGERTGTRSGMLASYPRPWAAGSLRADRGRGA